MTSAVVSRPSANSATARFASRTTCALVRRRPSSDTTLALPAPRKLRVRTDRLATLGVRVAATRVTMLE
jgi:hypothetical protein